MKRILFACVLSAAVLAAGTAGAVPISPINARPVNPLGSPYGSEWSLQQILTSIYPNSTPDAITGQQSAGMWGSATGGGLSTSPTVMFEFAGYANTNAFGIWFGSDTTNIYQYDLLLGPASPAAPTNSAQVLIQGNTLWVNGFGCGLDVNCTSGAGITNTLITPQSFGFYINVGGTDYYTVDQLNGGTARALAYTDSGTWTLAFEDGTDFDYNDMVVKVGSIAAVPEPDTMLLLGTGLFGLAAAVRRRMKK